jgi:fructose-1,6-bisphosphatase I
MVVMYPAGYSDAGNPKGKLHPRYEAAPASMSVEQAGGRARAGTGPVLDLEATECYQRAPVILGSLDDVELAEDFQRLAKKGDAPWGRW